ncbi:cobalamin-binding protein, partial [Deltaproteobacteria bacterium]|nr:cobalamin-binding protein [Deltaproteobacteria bacterium]
MKKIFLANVMVLIAAAFLSLWVSCAQCAVFRDSLGREVDLKRVPERIVSLAPNITEILFYLGLGDRVVGVTRFSNYPPEAANKPRVGSYIDLNVEKIIGLSPDLVIGTVSGNEAGVIALLQQAGIQSFIVNARNVREIIESVIAVGYVCGISDKAEQMAAGLNGRVDRVIKKIMAGDRPLVLLQINLRPIMTINRDSFLHDLVKLAGGENLSADNRVRYPTISLEEVIKRNPDVIIISSMERGGRFEEARQEWLQWNSIPAVKNNRVHLIDSDLIDRPSPRIVDGLEEMAR